MLFLFKVVYVFQFSVFYNICKENNYFEDISLKLDFKGLTG